MQLLLAENGWPLLWSGALGIVILISLTATTVAQTSFHRSQLTTAEKSRREYVELEQALWQYFDKDGDFGTNKDTLLKKVYEKHRKFINDQLLVDLEANKYNILNHYEWSLLERGLLNITDIFGIFRTTFLLNNKQKNRVEINKYEILDISNTVLRNYETISQVFHNIDSAMVKQALYYRAMMSSQEQICQTKQSAQQFLYSLYTDIALTELKGYLMTQFSWMILQIHGEGNFTEEAKIMRIEYEKRNERALKLLREVMRRADRIVWRCDPVKYIKDTNYDEVTRLLQGYIENEVDLNTEETCRETCDFYQATRSYGCFKDLYCARQPRCSGKLYQCTFVDSDMLICPSSWNSTRRYEFIEYENGRVLGQKGYCSRGTTKVDSWWRYLFWHCSYCLCLCDDNTQKSDRYFNLRETLADVMSNKVVIGLRFVKKKQIFHLQIQQGELLPRGAINVSTLEWKPIDVYQRVDKGVQNGRDYHTLSYSSRSIDLDDVHTDDNSYVVTGVRFRVIGAHLNLEARLSEMDFEAGKLVVPERNSFWKSNDNTDISGDRREKIELKNPDIPTRTLVKSIPDSRHNQYMDFVHSSLDKDAAQTTVPFIDIQDVTSNPPVPLAGIGVYHKGRVGYGGFIAPKLITYDFTPHVRMAVAAA